MKLFENEWTVARVNIVPKMFLDSPRTRTLTNLTKTRFYESGKKLPGKDLRTLIPQIHLLGLLFADVFPEKSAASEVPEVHERFPGWSSASEAPHSRQETERIQGFLRWFIERRLRSETP